MYTPSFYRENRQDLIAKVIRENSLATILSTNAAGEISVSHLPLILQTLENGQIELWGHMARANPHWKELSQAKSVKIIFQGPNAYISPAWYIEKADNVPTWNYVVVHASGQFEIIQDPKAALSDMNAVIGVFEQSYGTSWNLSRKDGLSSDDQINSADISKEVSDMLKYIVVFRFKSIEFDAKFKLGQKLDTVSRETVISELKALSEEKSDTTLFDVAEFMELTRS